MARDLTEDEAARADLWVKWLLKDAPSADRPAPAAARWGIVELLGHRRLYGLVGECELASGTFLTV